eukprot:CAMPEP_0174990616 /NCGR_PEP_ID=MMETSP0004_2-20121128/21426_1 /TAXON_ID=420556 /ORGANISM="Ochromonas sp., Strain CCMP1393" /LENGTH=358 /DNA_ID=CAMNT_0016244255 /DNA_START=66 /DNA_END=1143 /DNA_ORIENTATION=-
MSSLANRGYKVAVLGASGGIGQPLALLLKLDPKVSELSLFDVVRTPGVAADISHCCTPAKVTGHVGMEEAASALTGAKVVVIPAGVPRKPGMTRDDLFNTNASIVMGLAEACAKSCPDAMFLVISNPVNSTVPIFAETLKKHGVFNPKKLFGVTTLDVVRANTFVSENQGKECKYLITDKYVQILFSPLLVPSFLSVNVRIMHAFLGFDVSATKVNVIGGHAGTTILPLLSQVPGANFSEEDVEALTHRIQFGGDEVVKAKDGAGSATLSMAYAGQIFTSRLLAAISGESNVVECSFVQNDLTAAPYFSTPVRLGPNGVEEVLPYGPISAKEQAILDAMVPDLVAQAQKGIDFVAAAK